MLLVNQVISLMDAICMWSLNKSFISCSLWQLISVVLMLCLHFFYHFFAIPRSHNAHPCMLHLCNKGILISGILSNGVMIKEWWRRNETKSLLWEIDTCLYCSTHAGVEIANHDPLYNYVGVLYPRGHSLHLSFVVLPGGLYIGPKSSESFFRSYEGDDLWKNYYWTKMIEDYKKW